MHRFASMGMMVALAVWFTLGSGHHTAWADVVVPRFKVRPVKPSSQVKRQAPQRPTQAGEEARARMAQAVRRATLDAALHRALQTAQEQQIAQEQAKAPQDPAKRFATAEWLTTPTTADNPPHVVEAAPRPPLEHGACGCRLGLPVEMGVVTLGAWALGVVLVVVVRRRSRYGGAVRSHG
ncbi:MAG: hypothetical protein AAFS10_12250 [Myxococcota bacterium]